MDNFFAGLFKVAALTERYQLAVALPGEIAQLILFAPLLQRGLTEQRQAQQMRAVALIDRATAGSNKRSEPAPLGRVQARA